jgi:hypothetical protein
MLNNMKGKYMNVNKKYEQMKSKVDKLLDQVDEIIVNFDNKFQTNVSKDIYLTIDALKEKIEDNACDSVDFDEEDEVDSNQVSVFDKSKNIYYNIDKDELQEKLNNETVVLATDIK